MSSEGPSNCMILLTYGNNDWVISYRLLLQTWNAATKSHNTYVVIMKRFVQPTVMLPGPDTKVTIDPQNNAKPTHVSVAVHTSGFGRVQSGPLPRSNKLTKNCYHPKNFS